MMEETCTKKILMFSMIALMIGAFIGCFWSVKTVKADDASAYELVAHRGYSGRAPENSMPAFQLAVQTGYPAIELDIRRTAEDSNGNAEWVISHDDNLKDTMGVDKNISELTYAQVKKYSYTKGSNVAAYKNLKIVSLPEIIEYIKQVKASGKKVNWLIEIKTLVDSEQRELFEDEIVKPIEEAGIVDCVTFMSFHYSYLRTISKANQDFKIWFLAVVLDEDYIEYARKSKYQLNPETGKYYYGNADGITFEGSNYTTDAEMMKTAMSEGFRLGVYTIDSPKIMGGYYQLGVRSFTTNDVNPNELSVDILNTKYKASKCTVTLSKTSYTFDNARKKPTVKVKYKGDELLAGLNYELSYSNNKNPGTAAATITGLNNITGEKDTTYKIKMPKVKNFKVVKSTSTKVYYKWSKAAGVTGYKVYKYNYKTKKYKCVKTIKKNSTVKFTAKKLKTASKYRYRVKTYFTENKKTYKSTACTGKTTYTKPGKETYIRLKRSASMKAMSIAFRKVARATGYEIKVASDKNFTKNVKSARTTTKLGFVVLHKLNKKATYYVKVRAYKKVGKKRYYGAYSKVKHKKGIKTKKSKK